MGIESFPGGSIPTGTLSDIQARLRAIEDNGSLTNMLLNGDFEVFFSGTEPQNWNGFWGGGTRTFSQDTTNFARGGSSWKVAYGTDTPFGRMQSNEFRVIPGETLRATARWMTAHIGGGARIYIQTSDIVGQANYFGTNATERGMGSNSAASAINVWQTLSTDVVVPAGHIAARFVIESNPAAGVAHNIWADSASLTHFATPSAVDDTGWIAPTLSSPWGNYGTTWETAGYRRKNGVVYLRGLLTPSSAPGGGANIWTLPVGFRPGSDSHIIAATGVSPWSTLVNVLSTGEFRLNQPIAAGQWLSAANISFPAGG